MSAGDLLVYLTNLPPIISTGAGVVGFFLYLANYTLVTFRIVDSQGVAFFAINIGGASLVLVSLAQNFNLGSALIQIFWIVLGTIAIFIRLRARRLFRERNSIMLAQREPGTIHYS